VEGAKELSMLYFNHANEHISLGQKGRLSKRNGLISVYSYYLLVGIFKITQVHEKSFSIQHCIASIKLERAVLNNIRKYCNAEQR
jgi:hypothetical protein